MKCLASILKQFVARGPIFLRGQFKRPAQGPDRLIGGVASCRLFARSPLPLGFRKLVSGLGIVGGNLIGILFGPVPGPDGEPLRCPAMIHPA